MKPAQELRPCSSCGAACKERSGMFVWNTKDLLYDRVCHDCTGIFTVWAETAGHLEEEGVLAIDWESMNIRRPKS